MDVMDIKTIVWIGVVLTLTLAYGIGLAGIRSARRGEVQPHSYRMTVMSTIIGIWLISYVTKQLITGPERFEGSTVDYWRWYFPLLALHMLLALATVVLIGINLYTGLTKLRYGIGVGAMTAGVSRHRRLGRMLIWSLSGTMVTAYGIYLMLFVLFPNQ